MPPLAMKVGVLAGRFTVGEYDLLRDCAVAAETAGLDAFYRSDHHLSLDGDFDRPITEAWTTLSGLARETSRITLGILVSPAHFRHPTLLARMAATVDRMSGGRLEVGLGAGGFARDLEIMGHRPMPLRHRYSYLREYVQCLRGLWAEDSFTFHGEHFEYDGVRLEPRPLQIPGPPIIVGGKGRPAMIDMVAELGVELNLDFPSEGMCREVRTSLAQAAARHRTPAESVPVSVEQHLPVDDHEILRLLDEYSEIGISRVVFFAPDVPDAPAVISALGHTVSKWKGRTLS
jgi:alkanesulfonate monooxygenase SsuD/methylene tetrahydromethanopterin reductase-like flavin-dependent oxidoreductase (luciferase family)